MNDHTLTEVEHLITPDQRRVSIEEHRQFREAIATPEPFDAIDDAAADPIHDHAPRRASHGKVNRVLSILDQLDRDSNRRFTP
jgi:hypothetical protein